jgi:hypothetical protein
MAQHSHRQSTRDDGAATDRIPVSFQGDGAGVGDLSWGQQELWGFMQRQDSWLPIGAVLPLPPGTTVEDAVADLRFAASSYPTMRTRLRLDPDRPRQVISATGEIELEVIDTADDADPAEVAAAAFQRHQHTPYEFTTDWPVRMSVIRHRGVLTHRAWVMCHLVTDGFGAVVILKELAGRDASGSRAAPAPLEQARWQNSPAGQRQCAAALRQLRSNLLSLPARRFPPRTGGSGPRYWQGRFTSPALHLATRAIATRTGVEVPSVMLGIFAVALARVTGINPVATMTVVNNRFRPGLADSVSPLMQTSLCVIDVPDATVDEAVRHTRRRAMTTYKYAYCDPLQRDDLITRIGRERGGPVDLSCIFNDSRITHRDGSDPRLSPRQISARLPDTSLEWTHQQDEFEFEGLAIIVDDVPEMLQMTITCDTHHVSPDDVEATLHGMDELAVEATADADCRTKVPAAG